MILPLLLQLRLPWKVVSQCVALSFSFCTICGHLQTNQTNFNPVDEVPGSFNIPVSWTLAELRNHIAESQPEEDREQLLDEEERIWFCNGKALQNKDMVQSIIAQGKVCLALQKFETVMLEWGEGQWNQAHIPSAFIPSIY